MQTHETPSFQPAASSLKNNLPAPRPFEDTHSGQELDSLSTSPFPPRPHEVWMGESRGGSTNPFPPRRHEVYMGEPKIARKPVSPPVQAEVTLDPEASPYIFGNQPFRMNPPDAPPPSPRRWGIQAKVEIGQPNDVYEQEADRVAEQVMGMDSPATPTVQRQVEEEEPEELQTKPLAETITPLVQRQEDVEEEEPIQAKCEDCEAEEPIQRFADGTAQAQPDLENRLNSSKSGGSALPDDVRSFMEPRFGFDLSQVRVHTDSEAMQMNKDLQAQAFTHGSNIYFGDGKSPDNDALTAHELTHVVQQTGSDSLKLKTSADINVLTIQKKQELEGSKFIQRDPLSPEELKQKVKTMDADLDKELEKSEPDWQKVAYVLNGFSVNDIKIRLNQPKLKQHIDQIYDGAVNAAGVGAKSQIALFTQAVKQAKTDSFSEETIIFLRENSKSRPDFVAAIRDFIGLDTFSRCAKRLVDELTKEIQDNYKKALTEASKAGKSANTVVTPEKPIPNDQVQEKLDQLKVLDPLAAIQLQAVITASADLASGKVGKPEVIKATKLETDMQWCGAFAQKSYGKLDTTQVLINPNTFWSTQKLNNFFNYGNKMAGAGIFVQQDDKSWKPTKNYHKERGSVRKWIPNSEIAKGGSLDIRPGDIGTVWNHGSDVGSGDHIQMVQSWDATTKTLFTIAGNDGGYKIDNRPPDQIPAATDKEADKIKKIQDATGFTLTPGSSGGANVGVNFHNLSDEVVVKNPNIPVPNEVSNETKEQKDYRAAIANSKFRMN